MTQSRAALKSFALGASLALGVMLASGARSHAEDGALIRSTRSGNWSAPATWEGGKVPTAGARVQIRPGHLVVYDANSPEVIRAVFVGGTLRFAPDRDTRLDVGLLKIQAGEDTSEEGFDCDAHLMAPAPGAPKPALEIGTAERPIDPGHTALVRLTYVQGMDAKSCPAIVDCGGRMELHGQPMNRTWVKLAQTALAGGSELEISEPVSGWSPGDRLVITTTTRQRGSKGTLKASVRDWTQTEERFLKSVSGTRLVLDEPLQFQHLGEGTHRAEVADLSRNVVIESADPKGVRGHTMYHRGSAGSISYAEFRHLGKEGQLGRYSLHFHRVGDTMRGASVIGASIWDSANRWVTIHGTNYLVVRDCVGYRSVGHGFFLEDGTEAYNVLDRNLAIQACVGKPLPGQVMPGDRNAGAGFWWSNSRNSFTRNLAAECDEYGYRFDAPKDGGMDLTQPVQQPDGSMKPVDIRTLPFIRFDDNEAHSMRQHAFNLGGGLGAIGGGVNVGVNGVGPDVHHPFIIRNLLVWDAHWGFHAASPCVMVDGLHFDDVEYAMWRTVFNKHAYRNVKQERIDGRFEYYGDGVMPKESSFPGPLKPLDDLPPATVITRVLRLRDGKLLVRGTTTDNGEIRRVLVNGREAKSLSPDFLEWEVMLDGADKGEISAHAEDAAGNVEPRPHVIAFN